MSFNGNIPLAVQIPGTNNVFDPGTMDNDGGGLQANILNDEDLRERYEQGRQIFARILTLPREEQILKLQILQVKVLEERRKRLQNAKALLNHAQILEDGVGRILQLVYRNYGNLPGDQYALNWLQESWLKRKEDKEKAEKEVNFERGREEMHRNETLPDFETRMLRLLGLVKGDVRTQEQSNENVNVETLQAGLAGHPAQVAHSFLSNSALQQLGETVPSVNSFDSLESNDESQQMSQMAPTIDPIDLLVSYGVPLQMTQMVPPVNSVTPFVLTSAPQQMGQMGPPANSVDPFVSNGAPQQMGQMALPVDPTNLSGSTNWNSQTDQITPSPSPGNLLVPNALDQGVSPVAPTGSMSMFSSSEQTSQVGPQESVTNFLGPSYLSQQEDQTQPQGYPPSDFGSNAFLQRMGQTVQPGGFNPFLDNAQAQQMPPGLNIGNDFSNQLEYPSSSTSILGNNNSMFSVNPQIPAMAINGPIDWQFPIQESVNTPTIPAHADVFGTGVDWARMAPNFGPQIYQPVTAPAISSVPEAAEGEPFDLQRFLDNRVPDLDAQNGVFVFRSASRGQSTTTESDEMGANIGETVEQTRENGEESSSSEEDSDDEQEDRSDDAIATDVE